MLYVTIRLTDIHNHKLDVTEEKLIFRFQFLNSFNETYANTRSKCIERVLCCSGTGGTQDRPYYCELEFFRPVKPQVSRRPSGVEFRCRCNCNVLYLVDLFVIRGDICIYSLKSSPHFENEIFKG